MSKVYIRLRVFLKVYCDILFRFVPQFDIMSEFESVNYKCLKLMEVLEI